MSGRWWSHSGYASKRARMAAIGHEWCTNGARNGQKGGARQGYLPMVDFTPRVSRVSRLLSSLLPMLDDVPDE
jgi:hypothetical protein